MNDVNGCDILIFVSPGSIKGSRGRIGDYLGAEQFHAAFPKQAVRIVRFCDPTTIVTFVDEDLTIEQQHCPAVTLGKCRSFIYFPASFEPEDVALRPLDALDAWSHYLHRQWRVVADYIEQTIPMIGPCINDPTAARRACNELLQFPAARRHGLLLPETTITNDASEAENALQFRASVRKYISEGPSGPGTTLSAVHRVNTSGLRGQGLPDAAPLAYQRFVGSSKEVRLYIVGGDVVAVEIERKDGEPDVRYQGSGPESYAISDAYREFYPRLLALTREMRLSFAVVDAIPTPEGLVFLELNPNGTWRGLPEPIATTITTKFHDAVRSQLTKPTISVGSIERGL